jgi:hypothetical protein
MSATVVLILVVGGWVLISVVVGALIALGGARLSDRRHRDDESGLGEEGAAAILYGEPSWWTRNHAQANGGTDHPEEPVA